MINRSKALSLDFLSHLGVRWTQRPCPGNLLSLELFKAPPGILLFIGPFGLQRPRFKIFFFAQYFYVRIDCLSPDICVWCLPHCLFSNRARFNQFGFLPFSFYLSSFADCSHQCHPFALILLFCRLLISTNFCSFFVILYLLMVVTCNDVSLAP